MLVLTPKAIASKTVSTPTTRPQIVEFFYLFFNQIKHLTTFKLTRI